MSDTEISQAFQFLEGGTAEIEGKSKPGLNGPTWLISMIVNFS